MTLYTPNEYNAFRMIHTPATFAAAAIYGNWVSLAEHRSVTFIMGNGELDGDFAVAAFEATDSAGSGAQALTGKSDSFVNGTDEGLLGLITVYDYELSSGFTHVTIKATAGATDSFACFAMLSNPNVLPAVNTVGTHVAFDV